MYRILASLGSKVGKWAISIATAYFVDAALTKISSKFTPTTAAEGIAAGESLVDKVLLSVVYAKYGLPGVAALYDAGVFSSADLMTMYAMEQGYNLPPISLSVFANLENAANDSSNFFSSLWTSAPDINAITDDPNSLLKTVNYLRAFDQSLGYNPLQ